ncbi:hypothetical protein QBC45DRAFT_442207 [Copromyces sp. CBS 386.78]|nr:hypothetical protein QBC45DRAFT_442207 [Copromyces sp. CBS 386.78]
MRGFLEIYGHVDPHSPIGYNISTEVQRLIQSLINTGSFVSAFAIYFLGSRISRRLGLWIGCALAFLSVSIMIGVENLGGLYAGRLLLGMSNGFLVPYNVMFVSESAPSLLTGPILGMTILQTSLGALFGILVDNYTNGKESSASWRIPLGVMFIVPSLLTGFLFFLPDTPRFYVMKGEDGNALNAIRRLRGIKDEAVLRAEVEDIRSAYEMEQELHAGVHLKDMFCGTDLRRTLLSYGCIIGGTCTGITFMAGFSLYLFLMAKTVGTEAGINAFFGWMVSFFSPYFINSDKLNWGPTYGYIWGGSNLILAVWTWVFVPETKGRSLEQLDELFEKRVGARQFSSFVVERQLVDDIVASRAEGSRSTASRIGRKKHLH